MSFVAEYPGECSSCGGEVKGMLVNYASDEEIVHVSCPKQPEVCPHCHLQHAGECF